jgi:hypothetical protein
MSRNGRYFSDRDMSFINGINNELLGDIIQTEVTIFKFSAENTQTNIYGESKPSIGKTFYPGIDILAYIDRSEIANDADDFGPDRKQNVVFKFMEKDLQAINLFPSSGDLIFFNERYHEIDDVVQEQFLGGQPDNSFSIIINCHYTRLSKVDVVERQS